MIKRSTAQDFPFYMGQTGLTVTVRLSKDGAALASAAGAVSELSFGWYKVALTAADTDAAALGIHASADGVQPYAQTLITEGDYTAARAAYLDAAVSSRVSAGPGGAQRYVDLKAGSGSPVIGAQVWLTSDAEGADVVGGAYTTDDAGRVAVMVDVGATYYVWCDSASADFTNPTEWTVS
ncbi:MAG: hypothetical protein ACYC2Y_10925 [Armatimonadota bacterium]